MGGLHEGAGRYTVASQAPPRFEHTLSGSATSGSIFCTIPIDNTLYATALERLHASAGALKPYEFIDNLREDVQTSCFVFYGVRLLTVSADLYEIRTPVGPPFPMATGDELH